MQHCDQPENFPQPEKAHGAEASETDAVARQVPQADAEGEASGAWWVC